MLNLIISAFLSLLPRHWRGSWSWRFQVDVVRGALISGLLEFAGCLAAYNTRYLLFFDRRIGEMTVQAMGKGAEEALESTYVQFGMGFTTTLEYVIGPVSVLLMYFCIEGMVRFAAALISDEVVPTLPLQLLAYAQQRVSKAAAERALGPRVVDEVQPGDGNTLRILSCRPKEGWNHLMTISYQDHLYEIARQEEGAPPRRFIYLLQPKPEHKVVRGLHHYDPTEALNPQ